MGFAAFFALSVMSKFFLVTSIFGIVLVGLQTLMGVALILAAGIGALYVHVRLHRSTTSNYKLNEPRTRVAHLQKCVNDISGIMLGMTTMLVVILKFDL